MRTKMAVLLILGLLNGPALAQELILSAPPRESADAGKKLYGPLASLLSRTLGKTVRYQHPGNWFKYQKDMREGKLDIVFDGPHFAAWRMVHLDHHALVKLPGKLQFHLLTRKDNEAIKSPDDLVGRTICGISPPNLSTLSIMAYYNNPVRQPVIKGIRGGMGKVLKAGLTNEQCDAFVLRTTFYKKKVKPEQKLLMRIVYTSPAMPNQVITVGKQISAEEREKLRDLLSVRSEGKAATAPIIKRFAPRAKHFLPATDKEYEGYNRLLEGVIFGW